VCVFLRGITLFSLCNLALRNIIALLLAAVLFGAGAFAYCEFVAVPRYSATGSLLITNGAIEKGTDIDENGQATKLENANVIASINFMDTANDMLKQNGIYKKLSEKLKGKYSYNQLMSMSKAARRGDNSLYIDITFTSNSPEQSIDLVNEYMSIAPSFFAEQVTGVNVSYFEVDSASKIFPTTFITVVIFAFLGAALAYSIFLILFLLNTTIVNETDFKERFDIPIIGAIPDFASARSKKYGKYYGKYKKYGYYSYYERGNNNGNPYY